MKLKFRQVGIRGAHTLNVGMITLSESVVRGATANHNPKRQTPQTLCLPYCTRPSVEAAALINIPISVGSRRSSISSKNFE